MTATNRCVIFMLSPSFCVAVFETFFIDVNLERTNSTCILITPGCGVFDVDRELTGMTKQRLADGGR